MKTIPFILMLAALLAAENSTGQPPAAADDAAREIDPGKEILIRDPKVVDSTLAAFPGPFSFGGVLQRLGEQKAPEMVRDWLETWTISQEVSSQRLSPRPAVWEKIAIPWQKKDGFDSSKGEKWMPNLANAPFRLLAIVNRLDLAGIQRIQSLKQASVAGSSADPARSNNPLPTTGNARTASLPRGVIEVLPSLDPSSGSAGCYDSASGEAPLLASAEGRFVFCATDEQGEPLPGGFTVILEFPLREVAGLNSLSEWAQAWHKLGSFSDFDSGYLAALQRLTDVFTTSAPMRFRTSEKCFAAVRQMREFRVPVRGGPITPALLASTPCMAFSHPKSDENKWLGQFLRERADDLAAGKEGFPGSFRVSLSSRDRRLQKEIAGRSENSRIVPVLAASCDLPEQEPGFIWSFQDVRDASVRREFSLQTCNGCHCGETGTADGLHIKPRRFGQMAEVSRFLSSGKLVLQDPGASATKVTYSEMDDRVALMEALLESKDRRRDHALERIARERSKRSH